MKTIEAIFSHQKLRLTAPRRHLFESLKLADHPLSHAELITANPQIDRVSVYRTIALFVDIGIVVTVPHGWKQHYELAAPFRPHHHHLLCVKCGRVEDIQSNTLEEMVRNLARDQGFTVIHHTFEVSGLCNSCQNA